MNFSLDLVLIVVLCALMFYRPTFLTSLTTSVLGRIVLVTVVAYIATQCAVSGLIAALIVILMMHNQQEAMTSKMPKDKKKKTKNGDPKNEKTTNGKGKEEGKKESPSTKVAAISKKPDKVKESIQNRVAKKKRTAQTTTNKTDLERQIQKEAYVNSQVAKGENGGKGYIKKKKKK